MHLCVGPMHEYIYVLYIYARTYANYAFVCMYNIYMYAYVYVRIHAYIYTYVCMHRMPYIYIYMPYIYVCIYGINVTDFFEISRISRFMKGLKSASEVEKSILGHF